MSAKEPLDLPQAFKKAQELYAAGTEEKREFLDLVHEICSALGAPPVSDEHRFKNVWSKSTGMCLTFCEKAFSVEEEKAISAQFRKRLAVHAVAEGKPVDPDSVPTEFLERLKPFMVTNQK